MYDIIVFEKKCVREKAEQVRTGTACRDRRALGIVKSRTILESNFCNFLLGFFLIDLLKTYLIVGLFPFLLN